MATLEERVTALEAVLVHDFANPLKAIMLKVDEQNRDIYELDRKVSKQGDEIHEIKGRLAIMDTRLGGIDLRLNHMDEKIDSLREEMDTRLSQIDAKFDRIDAKFDQMDAKFDQVIVLLTRTGQENAS